MTLPNFFIIGAAKSGTSSLYMYLKQHPDIFMSPVKEPHFFSFDDESKLTKGPGDPLYKAVTNFEEYQALFQGVMNEKAIGEASTSYLYRPEAPRRIRNMLPNAKFIAILRNPVDRAFSAYMHVVRDQRETSQNFREALGKEEERRASNWEPIWHFTSVGFYHQQLLRYYNLFDPSQIKIFLYEDLLENQDMVVREIFSFLEVNPDFRPISSIHYNVSGKQKNPLFYKTIERIFKSPNPIRWFSRKVIPEIWRGNFTNWVRQQNLHRKAMSTNVRQELKSLFKDDIGKLQTLISKDLSFWLESDNGINGFNNDMK